MPNKILFVDDDSNILATFRGLLRKRYEVATSLGPEQGLESILINGPFAVVVSDLKMPKMDGIAFLTKVREISPETVRIILTGFAHVDAAIKAVNEGHVFRFLTKPCSADILSNSLDAGISQYNLVRAEKELLTGTLRGTLRVLVEALSLANPEAYGRTQRVRTLVRSLVATRGIKLPWELDLATMLSHLGCMALPRTLLEDIAAGKSITAEALQLYNSHPAVAAGLIEQIPRLESVAAIIASQQDNFDTHPPEGASYLKVALDYILFLSNGLTPQDAYGKMLTCKGSYDPELLEVLEKIIVNESGYTRKRVAINELMLNMILEEDIVTRDGMLLLAKNAELDETMIRRLIQASKRFDILAPVAVRSPENES